MNDLDIDYTENFMRNKFTNFRAKQRISPSKTQRSLNRFSFCFTSIFIAVDAFSLWKQSINRKNWLKLCAFSYMDQLWICDLGSGTNPLYSCMSGMRIQYPYHCLFPLEERMGRDDFLTQFTNANVSLFEDWYFPLFVHCHGIGYYTLTHKYLCVFWTALVFQTFRCIHYRQHIESIMYFWIWLLWLFKCMHSHTYCARGSPILGNRSHRCTQNRAANRKINIKWHYTRIWHIWSIFCLFGDPTTKFHARIFQTYF